MGRKKTIEEVREFIESQGYTLISDVYKDNKTKLKMVCDKGHEFDMAYNSFHNQGQRCPECRGNKKKTIEEIREFVEGQGYKLISDTYINNKTKLKMICNKGHEFETSWSSFYHMNSRCPECYGNKKKTIYKVREYIENQGYKLLSDVYVNNKTHLEVMCDKGHIYKTRFDSFKKGSRCPVCSGKQKYNIEEVKEYIENQGYKLLSKVYINNQTKLKMVCDKGHKFEMNYISFKTGRRCPVCKGINTSKRLKYNYDKVKKEIESIEGYKLLSTEYVDSKTKLSIQCPQGHMFDMAYSNFNQGQRCPECMNKIVHDNQRLNYEEVKRRVEDTGYKLLSTKYIDVKSKLIFKCPDGHIFESIYNNFRKGSRCPTCNLSKGEEKIKSILEDYRISYNAQKWFDDCRYKNPLPFDFYIPEFNVCIEYDGEQHFKPIAFGSKKSKEELLEQFELNQLRDQIKTDYCKDNNIKLIRIPYTEFDNIEEILIKELNLKKVV